MICLEICENPRVCRKCPKVFCLPCLRLAVGNNNNICPHCQVDLNLDNIADLKSPPKTWFDKTKKLKIKCEDCGAASILYSHYQAHRRICPSRISATEENIAASKKARYENDPEKLNDCWSDLFKIIPHEIYPSSYMEECLTSFERYYPLEDVKVALNLSASMFFIVTNDTPSNEQLLRMVIVYCKAIKKHKGKSTANQLIYNMLKAIHHTEIEKYGDILGADVIETCLQVLETYDEDPGFKRTAAVILMLSVSSAISGDLSNRLPVDMNFLDRLVVLSDKAMEDDANLFLALLQIFWNHTDTNEEGFSNVQTD